MGLAGSIFLPSTHLFPIPKGGIDATICELLGSQIAVNTGDDRYSGVAIALWSLPSPRGAIAPRATLYLRLRCDRFEV
jgi:hypothetical protein